MFSKRKIALDAGLYVKAKSHASELGYASVDEFITHLLERELDGSKRDEEKNAVLSRRLEGLGYI
jgi:hypothetical protein